MAHPELLSRVDGSHLATEWLGQPIPGYGSSQGLDDLIGEADERLAQVLTLAQILTLAHVLAACEVHVGKDTRRRDGTTLAEVEDYAASDQTV